MIWDAFHSSNMNSLDSACMTFPSDLHRHLCVSDRLSLVPHPNIITAVAIDDAQTSIMPILLPKAESDFHAVLTSGRWAISELLRQVYVAAVMKCVS